MKPLAVVATGMITGVGLDAPSACAAIRCAIDRFEETRFMDRGGEWMIGSAVPLDPPSRGREKLVRMAASAIQECMAALPDVSPEEVPLLLCVAERERPGRIAGLDRTFLPAVSEAVGSSFHAASAVIAGGRIGGMHALEIAGGLIDQGRRYCLVAGVDSFLVGGTLAYYEEKRRLLTSENSNGFIPGEAAAAVLLGPPGGDQGPELRLLGIGFGREEATIESEEPLRADGLSAAFRAALDDAGCTFDDVDYRLVDVSGEQYGFKEAALAIARTMKKTKPEFDIWHPADCIGEVGAAIVPCILGVARAAAMKDYAPGKGVLCHCGNDDGARAAVILRYGDNGDK